jgi:hypothetical protein
MHAFVNATHPLGIHQEAERITTNTNTCSCALATRAWPDGVAAGVCNNAEHDAPELWQMLAQFVDPSHVTGRSLNGGTATFHVQK